MKRRLKTLEQLREEFGFKFDGYDYETTFNDMDWMINDLKLEYLGHEIEVKELENKNWIYTHYGDDVGCFWHELWFEPVFTPIEFINENEFEL